MAQVTTNLPLVHTSIMGPQKKREKAVVVLSGGMDSTTLLYWVKDKGFDTYAFSINYGQKHIRELDAARDTCGKLGIDWDCLDFPGFGTIAPSALTSKDGDIPEGHYQEESMKQTVVPNRNMVLLSIAGSYAIGIKAKYLFYGAHSGDHTIYPDCRPEFVGVMQKAFQLCDWNPVTLGAPFLLMSKEMILREGLRLGVDYSKTFTCYKGGEKSCGLCGSCRERLEAFEKCGIKDPLEYE